MARVRIGELYAAALEALEVLGACRPGRGLGAAERAARKGPAAEAVLAFVRRRTRSGEWAARQDAALAALTEVV